MKNNLIFVLIILLALILRIWQLNILPPSLNWDEVSLGYNAYSILKTGTDEWGNVMPLSFRAYGDYKLPVYIYVDLPFVANFGLNEWSTRLPSVLAGVGIVIFTFLILRLISSNKIALWGAFLISITTWPLLLSRIALEANLALFLITVGVFFFLKGHKKTSFLIASAVFFGLAIFAYNSARVVTPLLLVFGIWLYKSQIKFKNKASWLALAVFIIFFAVALPLGLLQDSSARYKWTAIIDEGAINRINELRGTSALPTDLSKLTYNKVTYFFPEAIKNYLLHFDPRFLFLYGGSNYQFNIPGTGLLYLIYFPFLVWGVVEIFAKKDRNWFFIFGWLLIAPLPAAITRDSPHALRSLLIIPPILMITGLGIYRFIESFKKIEKYLSVGLVLIIFISFYFVWQNYSNEYVKNYSWSWQYGYKQIAEYLKENSQNYQKIYITKKYGEPHEFLLFYLQYDPSRYRNDLSLVRYFRSDWYWVDSFDKYIFINDWEVIQKTSKSKDRQTKNLLITTPGNYPEGSRILQTINFLDNKPAFDIVELQQVK
jgi:4-amino-4-deoxy-L-arabinose transferase-like glycosyltransferase